MRIRVSDVLDLLAAGLSPQQVLEELPDLEADDIAACLRFASSSRRSSHRRRVTLRLDAQISPALAPWLTATCGIACSPVRDLGLRDAGDRDIFMAGRSAGVVIVTKDADFVRLLEHLAVSSIRPHAGACGRSQILPYRRRQTPSPWSSFQSNPIEMAAQ